MFVLTLTLLLLVAAFLYGWLQKRNNYWAARNVPHEKPVLFFGNMSGLGSKYHWKDIHARVYKLFKGKEPFVGFYTFLNKAVLVLDLDMIKQILVTDFQNFSNRGLFHNVRDDPLTENLLQLDGEQWRVLRHKLSPFFSTGKMRFMFPTMLEVGDRLIETCNKLIEDEAGCVEAKNLCALYTTDVIGTCAFGIECNSLRDPKAEFRCMGRKVIEEPRHVLPVQAFMFSNVELAQKLRMKMFTDETSEFFMNAVRETVEYREKHNIKRNDFMDLLLELKAKRDQLGDQTASVDDFSNGLSLVQVAAQAFVFFLAGFDTSSTTMSFCMYELALHQHIQDRLRREIIETLAKYNNEVTFENIPKIHYLELVIAETLRKHPALPHLLRKSIKDCRLPQSEMTFEKDMRFIIPVYSIHHDPEYYPAPEIFDPDRFTLEQMATRPACAYLPFGDGPRNCIGLRFGKLQTKIGLISLLRNFRITTTEQTQIPLRYSNKSFLVATESGVHLKLERL